ncbi:MAG: hypothetical protein N2246_02435, partial [Candidatus Sumerlaeia bacterium]|nr:hypothetical protein [Candidatus Sumerlaeia bacterium]
MSYYSEWSVMINWRKPLILIALQITGSKTVKHLRWIKRISRLTAPELKAIQEEKIKNLLQYAYENVPYYRRILTAAQVVTDKTVNLERFSAIPFLTKDIIREHFEELKSRTLPRRKWFYNTSGGSTGEPVQFIQDKEYWDKEIAGTLFFFSLAGKDIGERELKLWGSERDILEGSIGLKAKVQNWLYNRLLLNSFMITREDMSNYVIRWNRFKPKVVWAYVDSIYEMARFIEQGKLLIFSPVAIIVTAGTLYPALRSYIEKIMHTKVLNQYGSREVGVIACECMKQRGLHLFQWKQFVEIVDKHGNSVPAGELGEIIVTNLENYAMPLIRYRIGDMGRMSEEQCDCGIGLTLLKEISGRVTDHFLRQDGTIIHGEYFTHLFYFRPWVKKFQVIQKDFNYIEVRIEKSAEPAEAELEEIREKIRTVMGTECGVSFIFEKTIKPLRSGKTQFTVSEIYQGKRDGENE